MEPFDGPMVDSCVEVAESAILMAFEDLNEVPHGFQPGVHGNLLCQYGQEAFKG
jgi:hypothetical protein